MPPYVVTFPPSELWVLINRVHVTNRWLTVTVSRSPIRFAHRVLLTIDSIDYIGLKVNSFFENY